MPPRREQQLETSLAECLGLLADEYQFAGHGFTGGTFTDKELVRRMDALLTEYLVLLKCDPGLLEQLWSGSELPRPTGSPHPAGQ